MYSSACTEDMCSVDAEASLLCPQTTCVLYTDDASAESTADTASESVDAAIVGPDCAEDMSSVRADDNLLFAQKTHPLCTRKGNGRTEGMQKHNKLSQIVPCGSPRAHTLPE